MNPVRNNSNRTSIADEMRETNIVVCLRTTDRVGQREAAGHSRAGSAEKETAWTISIFFGITQSVPISVIVALTGENFGLVMFAFFSVRFLDDNDRRDSFC